MKVQLDSGETIELGMTATAPTIGIVDYSRMVTDDYGVTTVVKRGFARRMSVQVAVPFGSVDAVQRRLADLRATSALWIADDRFASLTVRGFYKEFSIDVGTAPLSYCTLSVEGLTETDVLVDDGRDPAPAGQPSTLELVQPVIVTDTQLVGSNVPENDAPEWSASSAYPAGVRVIKAAAHRIYESVAPIAAGDDPAGVSGKWLDVGPTNRWAMFDQALGSVTTGDRVVVVTINTGAIDAVALLDVDADTVRVQAAGYDRSMAAVAGSITFLDLPANPGQITVTIAGGGAVAIGTLLVGNRVALGLTEASPTAGITDYSKKLVDDFGAVTVVPRAWAKKMTANALIRTDAVDIVANRIAAVRATPSLWIGQDGLDSLTIYGFFKDFSIEVGEGVSKLALSIDGLSTAGKVEPLVASAAWPDITDPLGTKPADNADVTGDAYKAAAGQTIKQTVTKIDDLVTKAADLTTMYGDTANASASAALAKTASQASQTAQSNAEGAMANAIGARDAAATARDAALGAASTAQSARDQAGTARAAAADASAQAQQSAATAAQRASDATGFAQTASGQATIATQKADAAGQAASTATAKADIASTKAGEAMASAASAVSSKNDAAGSATTAVTQAGVSASNAAAAAQSTLAGLPQTFDPRWWMDGIVYYANPSTSADATGLVSFPAGYQLDGSKNAISSKFVIPVTPGNTYEVTVDYIPAADTVNTRVDAGRLFLNRRDAQGIYIGGQPGVVWDFSRGNKLTFRYVANADTITVNAYIVLDVAGSTSAVKTLFKKFTVEDVTARDVATAAASASSGSANTASLKADAAGQSASAAAASATAANTSAGSAGTSASQASTSATNAFGSSNSAATQSSAAAQSAANAANSANAASTSAQTAATSQTAAGQSASAAQASATSATTQAGNAQGYAGQAATSASQASTSATNANGSANTASSFMQQAASSRDAAGGSAGAAASSASIAQSASNTATSQATSATTAANNAYNQYLGSVGQAQSASSSAASASASATAASQSATISASLSTNAINANPDFNVWSTAGGLPDGWGFWTNSDNTARVAGILSRPYAVRQSPPAGERLGFYQSNLRMTRGWCVLEGRFRGYNSFSGAGVRFSGADTSYDLNFATDPDVAGNVRGGAENAGWSYVYSKLIYVSGEDYGAVLYAFTAYDGLGDISVQKQIDWDHVAVRTATDGEIAGKRADGNATTALAQIATNASAQASQNAAQATVNSNVNATLNNQAAINTSVSQAIANNYAAASQQISTLSAYAATNQNYAPALTSWARAGGYSVLTSANSPGWTWGTAVLGSMPQTGEFSLAQTPAIYMTPNQNVTFSADLLCFGDGNQYVKLNILTYDSSGNLIDDRRGPECRTSNFSDSRARSTYAVTAYLASNASYCILRVLGQNASSASNPAGARRPKFEAGGIATAYTEEGAAASLSASVQVLQQTTADVQRRISTAVFQVLAQAGTSLALLKLTADGYGASQIALLANSIRLFAQSDDDPTKAVEALTVRSDGRVDIPNLMTNFSVVPAFGYFNGPKYGAGPDSGTSGGNTPTPIRDVRRNPGQSTE